MCNILSGITLRPTVTLCFNVTNLKIKDSRKMYTIVARKEVEFLHSSSYFLRLYLDETGFCLPKEYRRSYLHSLQNQLHSCSFSQTRLTRKRYYNTSFYNS